MSTALARRDLTRARAATTVAFVAQGVALAILVTRTPTLKARLDLSDTGLGLLLVVIPTVAAAGSVLAGWLASRFGSKAVLRVCGPVVPGSVVVVGISGSLTLTTTAVVVLGTAMGATDACMNMQATSVQHAYGRPIISSCYAWFSLASLAGALLASAAAALELPLGVFFLACAVALVASQVAVGRHLMPDVAVEMHATPSPVPWRPIILIGLGLTCAGILDSAASNWSAVFLVDEVVATEAVAALGYGVYSLALLIGQIVVDRLDVRFGPVTLMRVGAVLGVVAVTVVVGAPSPVVALTGFAFLGLFVAPIFPLAFTAAAFRDPDRSGQAVARVNVFHYVGLLLGAPLLGALAETFSLRIAFAATAVAPLLVLALATAYRTDGV